MAKNCINPKCEKEIPSNATFCSFCGAQQIEDLKLTEEEKLRKELQELQGTIDLLKKALADAHQNNDSSVDSLDTIQKLQSQLTDLQSKNITLQSTVSIPNNNKPFPTAILVVGISLLILIGGLIGYFEFYVPFITDRDAPRYYSFATNTFIRSSKESGVEYNKLGSVPYGSELIIYSYESDWSEVKWMCPQTGETINGYISTVYILNQSDFTILNALWGDNDSKEIINTSKCRIALLNYFKEFGYTNEWRVFSKTKGSPLNSTYFYRVVNSDSKFTDFAVIIRNVNTGERKCLLFSFDDDETPHLVYEEIAPIAGDIAKIKRSINDGFIISYK